MLGGGWCGCDGRTYTTFCDAVNADASFNRISVDTDTSPSDTVAIMASGKSKAAPIRKRGEAYDAFAAALADLCKDLAYQIVKDGEGATKVIRVIVEQAKSEPDAVKVARTIAAVGEAIEGL